MAAARSSSGSAASWSRRLRRRLRAARWRPVAGLAGGSLGFSLALVGYLFGLGDHFFGRLFTAFAVVFGLLAFTFWAAVPFVGWAAANWFGRGWAAAPGPGVQVRRTRPGGNLPAPAVPLPRANSPRRVPAPGSYS